MLRLPHQPPRRSECERAREFTVRRKQRYADPAWTDNPLLRRAVQVHIAATGTADELVEDAELGWSDHERVRFAVGNISGGYYYQLLAGAGWSSLPALGLIRQPTLIISGDDDPIIPAINAKIMHKGIPDSRLHLYSGGHLALLTEAAEFAPVIDGFLAD